VHLLLWFRWLSNRFPAMVEGRLHAPNLMRTLVIHLTVWAQAACGVAVLLVCKWPRRPYLTHMHMCMHMCMCPR